MSGLKEGQEIITELEVIEEDAVGADMQERSPLAPGPRRNNKRK